MTSPLSTIIWLAVTFTAGYRRRSSPANIQWVVAGLPSSRPASATKKAPVHEPAILAPAACHLASHGTQRRVSSDDAPPASSPARNTTTIRAGAYAPVVGGCRLTASP